MIALEVAARCSALIFLFFTVFEVNAQSDFDNTKITAIRGTEYLHCSNTTAFNGTDISLYTPMAWMIPDLTVLRTSQDKYQLLNSNWTLQITNVSSKDLGLYNCLLQETNDGTWKLVRLGLNAAGPYFQTYWDVYKWNTIIGLCSAGVFCIVVAVIYALHRFLPNVCLLMDKTGSSVRPEKIEIGNSAENLGEKTVEYETVNAAFDGDQQKDQ